MELLVPAAIMVGFTIIWLIWRPDPERARQIERAVLRGARIVDVRAPHAFRQCHVNNAENVPLDQLPGSLLPEQHVVVYGQQDEDSAEAARKLRALGFARVVDAGPMSHWPIPQPG